MNRVRKSRVRKTRARKTWSSLGSLAVACAFSSLALVACGAGAEVGAEAASPKSASSGAAREAPKPKTKVTQLRRPGVRETVRSGFGRFLQDVTVDDTPAFRNGKFLGFRVVELRGELDACDLRAGDVVTRVNGQSVEHPEDALVVFQSLSNAKELVVDYERDGAPQKLRLPIVD
jgi:type II secretory pathway component PulC